ncbi:MAG: nitroreductase family protein [Micromonosporaceae bacterium]|nr:nitroreductase family protein [Micromonosporaceae bacterium]
MTRTETAQALAEAARRALRAPSILNTQPWRWRVHEDVLELSADRTRQLGSIDPNGRLLTLSCGAALHHARVALSATGHDAVVERFPDPADDDLLARLRLIDGHAPPERALEQLEAMRRRHTDRRPFAATVPVPAPAISAMTQAAEHEDASLHRVPVENVPSLATAVETAAAAEARMADYQADLHEWTHRPRAGGDGVTAEAVTARMALPVHLRDFSGDETLLDPGFGNDRFAEFFILATANDTRHDWLRAGEATSAVWLTATSAGLVASVMSEVTEVPEARELLRRLLPTPAYPQLVFRMAVDMQPPPYPKSARRPPSDVIEMS